MIRWMPLSWANSSGHSSRVFIPWFFDAGLFFSIQTTLKPSAFCSHPAAQAIDEAGIVFGNPVTRSLIQGRGGGDFQTVRAHLGQQQGKGETTPNLPREVGILTERASDKIKVHHVYIRILSPAGLGNAAPAFRI